MPIKTSATAYLGLAQKLATGFPFSLVFWASSDSGGSSITPFTQSQASADRMTGVNFGSNGVSVYGIYRNPGSSSYVDELSSSLNSLNNTMKLYVLVVTSTTSATLYCNSSTGKTGALAATNDIANHDTITIGGLRAGGGFADALTGNIAECSVFSVALTSGNVATLLAGGKAEDIAGCVACFPLKNTTDLTSTNGTYTLTPSGTILAGTLAHPVTRLTPGPTISVQPASQTVTTPATATFNITAVATGGGTLSYQWKQNGGNVGTNSASLTTGATTVTGGTWNNGDSITCVVTETGGTNAGSITSSAATLTVNAGSTVKTVLRNYYQRGTRNV